MSSENMRHSTNVLHTCPETSSGFFSRKCLGIVHITLFTLIGCLLTAASPDKGVKSQYDLMRQRDWLPLGLCCWRKGDTQGKYSKLCSGKCVSSLTCVNRSYRKRKVCNHLYCFLKFHHLLTRFYATTKTIRNEL